MICPPLVMLYAGGLVQYPAFAPSSSETVTVFIFLGSKITADGDGNHEIKRCLLLGSYDQPMLKRRDITLIAHLVKAMVFLVVMNGCESGL